MKSINNQNGFTIIELITSFSLTMVVLVFLFNIVIIMKETYMTNTDKSELIVNQSLLSTALNEDFYDKAVSFNSVSCGSEYDKCYKMGFKGGGGKTLSISTSNNKIKYGDAIYNSEDVDFVIGDVSVCKQEYPDASYATNSYLQVKIEITSPVITDYQFGVNVIHLYDSTVFTTDLPDC